MACFRFLCTAALFSVVCAPAVAAAAAAALNHVPASDGFDTHTHTSTPSADPAPLLSPFPHFPTFADLGNSYKTAGVCFIGFGNCGDEGFYHKGSSSGSGGGTTGSDNFEIDTAQQCKNEGYTITSCPAGSAAAGICPYNGSYYSGCKSYEELCRQDNYYKSCSGGMVLDPDQSCGYDSSYKKCISSEEKCEEEGYHSSCEEGKILDPGQVCSYNSAYKKCVCDPCEGYAYSYDQATEQGYEPDGEGCKSCGVMKYKRKVKECLGFSVCDCGGEIGSTECWSGQQQMFLSCKECIEECDSGEIDLNNYWCNGDLKCLFGGR